MAEEIVVFSTCSSRDEAERLTEALISERKAACVNIIPSLSSVYWWKGKIERSEEVLLVIKTLKSLIEEVITLIKANHSYTVPEIIAVPIVAGNPDYLKWLRDEVRS
ncbi:MAG: divalent-cation tolerance protein CutA [Planctomycetota bacterium]|nr:divalent-cation tolerance protein CutA [Planctomycetota bacterium]